MPSYQESKNAKIYLDFLNSKNGQIQKQLLQNALLSCLPKAENPKILDAGCGNGWLAGILKNEFPDVCGCDSSQFLIDQANKNYPEINFKVANLQNSLPYPDSSFNFVILNMSGPDIDNLPEAFKNINKILKPRGKVLMAIPNPEYSYPAAEWKRNLLDVLLLKKPRLKFKTVPPGTKKIVREFGKGNKINSNYYSLETYTQRALSAGLKLTAKREIKSLSDSGHFDLNYQLYRYPLLLILEFQQLP